MKFLFSFCLVFFTLVSYQLHAQSLAINTDGSTADASALLDVKSNTKGIIIPRMTRTERNSIASPATGLLIFQTAPDSVGFHYYDGTKWTWMFSNSNTDTLAWRTGGNTGTTANHFFGTTDNRDIIFKRNNVRSGYIGSNNTSFGANALNPASTGFNNTALGLQALLSNTTSSRNTAIGVRALTFNTTGADNTAIGMETLRWNEGNSNVAVGFRSLDTNTTGSQNTALGTRSLISNTTGYNNTATGLNALFANTQGFFNTATGVLALSANKTGNANTAIGQQALNSNIAGSNNTALGFQSGFLATGSSNVFLGLQAGYNETGNNKLYIANNSNNPPIIYGDFANKTLGFGTITPNSTYDYAKVEIASEGYLAPADLLIRNAVNNAGYAPGLVFQHARGTLATPVAVNNGDYLSAISTMNYDGTNYILSAGLDLYADGAIATGIVPTRLQFNTMNTAGGYAARLTIKNDGKVGIGVTNPNTQLANNNGNTVSSSGVGLNDPSFNWSMNTGGYAAGFYNSSSNGVVIKTTAAGSRILDLSVAATQTAVGTPVMNVNANSTVGIATPSPNSTLHVDGTVAIGLSFPTAGGPIGAPVSLADKKSYVGVLPANATDNYFQLPDPTLYPGRIYIIRNNSVSFQAKITTAAGFLIPGSSSVVTSTVTLNTEGSPKTIMCISDGANWTVMTQD